MLGHFLTSPIGVIFLHALRAELEVAFSALAKVSSFVNLSWSPTIAHRAPGEVVHLVDCLAYRKLFKLIDKIFDKTNIHEVLLDNQSLAHAVIIDCWASDSFYLPISDCVFTVLTDANLAESMLALPENFQVFDILHLSETDHAVDRFGLCTHTGCLKKLILECKQFATSLDCKDAVVAFHFLE